MTDGFGTEAPVRVAIVGSSGRIAQDWKNAIDAENGAKLAATIDPTTATSGAHFASIEEFVHAQDALRCQAAIVASPPKTHRDLVERLLDLGLSVLCEKPFATSTDDAEAMLAAADRSNCSLVLASKFRFTPPVQAAQTWIADGRIGEPIAYENVFSAPIDMAERWNADPEIAGGGVLQDNGPHAADLARALCGPIASVVASTTRPVQKLRVEDGIRLMFRFESGAVGTSDLSWSLPAARQDMAIVRGHRGTLRIRWDGAELIPADGSAPQHRAEGYDKRGAFGAQLSEFLQLCRGRGQSTVDSKDALAAVAFVESAYRSLQEGRFIDIVEKER